MTLHFLTSPAIKFHFKLTLSPLPKMPNPPSNLFLFLLVVTTIHTTTAVDHIVGGHLGWNPGLNYTDWIKNQTFYVGDLISFRYQKYMYNVFEVNQTGYDNCTIDSAVGNWTKGKDFIPLDEAKRYYFICNGFCQNGMKISIVVHALPTNGSSGNGTATNQHHNGTGSSAPANFLHGGFGGGGVAVAAVMALVVGLLVA